MHASAVLLYTVCNSNIALVLALIIHIALVQPFSLHLVLKYNQIICSL
jgi:hypothetical protein